MRHTFELTEAETSLAQLLDALERVVSAQTGRDDVAGEIRLMAEEALTNVIKYGYRGDARPPVLAEARVSIEAEGVVLEIRDSGAAFDPLSRPSPDVDAPPQREGGLGICLLRSLADEARYRREGDQNVLSLRKLMA